MTKNVLFTIGFLLAITVQGQTTLFYETFENGNATWMTAGSVNPNSWIIGDCSGNGITDSGDTAAYISDGGSVVCTNADFAYLNAPASTVNQAIFYTLVSGTCATDLIAEFDYRIGGMPAEDFGELVYSVDGGGSWIAVGGALPPSTAWSTIALSLPAFLDGTSFHLGFRFTYNDATITAPPLAFDNLKVIGTDTVDPVILCVDDTVSVGAACDAMVPDYTNFSYTVSDNCTDSALIVITQDVPAGSTFASGPGGTEFVTLTATDESGNSAQCIITVNIEDHEAPVATCPADTTLYIGNNCQGIVPDYTSFVVGIDNCTTPGNLIFSQDPAPGTVITGAIVVTNMVMSVTDESGNTGTCMFVMQTIDTIPSSIVCPSDISTCDPAVTYTTPVFSDNCAVSLSQTDGTGLSSGSTFPIGITTMQYEASDSSGNVATCTFDVEVLEFPSQADIPNDTLRICGSSNTTLFAEAATSGTGEWSIVSGQGTFNDELANGTAVNGLGYQTNVFAWTISSPSCGSTSDTVVVITSPNPSYASISFDTVYACDNGTVDLEATPPLVGVGTWTTSGDATITNPGSNATTAELITNGWNGFVWTVETPACPPNRDSIAFLFMQYPNIQTSDSVVCLEDGSVNVDAGVLETGQEGFWFFAEGSGTIEDSHSPKTTISNFQNGINRIVYEVNHPWCPEVYDTLTIVSTLCEDYAPVIPTLITPNYDGKNDFFEIQYLQGTYPDCHVTIVNRWGSPVFESFGYEKPWDGRYKEESLPMGTYFYRIELNDESGTVLTGDISIIH